MEEMIQVPISDWELLKNVAFEQKAMRGFLIMVAPSVVVNLFSEFTKEEFERIEQLAKDSSWFKQSPENGKEK